MTRKEKFGVERAQTGVRIDAWTDFTCPLCFLAGVTLEKPGKEAELDFRHAGFHTR